MAIKLFGRRTTTVRAPLAGVLVCSTFMGIALVVAAQDDRHDGAAPNAQAFDTVAQSTDKATPRSSPPSDPFDFTPPSQSTPRTPSGNESTQTVPENTPPAVPPPSTAPTTNGTTPAAPNSSLPDNPFGAAVPPPEENKTAPERPQETMPGPAPQVQLPGPQAQDAVPTPEGGDLSAAQQEVKTASDLINQGSYVDALRHLYEAAKAAPDESAVYFYQGVAYRMLNHYDDAIAAFSKAIQLANQAGQLDPEAYLRRGVVWFYKGDYGIAWLDFDEASAILYDDPRPELWKGLSLAKQQNWLDAINSFAVALQHDDKFAPAWVNLGLGYLALNQPPKAVYAFNQAVRLEPSNAASFYKRGIALARMGKFREAADSYSDAIRLKPDYAEAYYNRSLVDQDLGNSQQAAKDREAALKINPQVERQATNAG